MKDARVRRHPLGFYQVVEAPSEDELRSYYADRYFQLNQGNYRPAYSDAERGYIDNKIFQKVALARELGYLGKPGHLLDVGCGEGFALAHFRRMGWQIEGIDYSSVGMRAMNPSCLDALATGDVTALLQERIDAARQYDVVWLSNVLEHVPDPVELLERLRRLLAPDGLLIVTVPNDFSPLQMDLKAQGKVSNAYWIAIPDHLSYFDKESLARTAESVGYHVLTTLAEFPIDWFLMHPKTNYIVDQSLGGETHRARIALEAIIAQQPLTAVNRFYRAMADIGMGRDITAFLASRRK